MRNLGAFTAVRVAFTGNAAGAGRTPDDPDDDDASLPGGGGGAIASQGQLQISASVFSGNRAGDGSSARRFVLPGGGSSGFPSRPAGDGGSILGSAGSATITSSTFTGSRAGNGLRALPGAERAGGSGGSGGAIAVTGGSASVENATFQGNRAGNSSAPSAVLDETARPGNGGAVAVVARPESPAAASVTFSTFSGNAVGVGPEGNLGVGASVVGASVGGSILADAGGACATSVPAPFANLTSPGDVSCPGGRVAGDPRLGALAANGGPTPTMVPGAGSPAINALVGVPCPGTDQRGLGRPALGACDIGAVEVQPGTPEAVGAPLPDGGAAARTVGGLKVGPAAFRASGRRPLGTTVTFRVSAAGPVVLTVRKAAAGKRSGRRCVAPTRRLRNAKRCVRQVTLAGRVTRQAQAGLNAIRFTGTLRGRALPAGAYTLVVTLPDVGANATRPFRILR